MADNFAADPSEVGANGTKLVTAGEQFEAAITPLVDRLKVLAANIVPDGETPDETATQLVQQLVPGINSVHDGVTTYVTGIKATGEQLLSTAHDLQMTEDVNTDEGSRLA